MFYDNNLVEIFDSFPNKKDMDLLLKALRDAGATQIQTTALLKNKLKISLQEAKEIVFNSSVWEDRIEANKWLQDQIDTTFNENKDF